MQLFFYKHLILPETLDDLAAMLGVAASDITAAAVKRESLYRTFQIKKNNGGLRTINSPIPSLYGLQKSIKDNILSYIIPSPSAMAYISGRSIISNADIHKNGKNFYTCDITDFFPSIRLERMIVLFSSIGFNIELSTILSMICTIQAGLPQGSPSSPDLSNIFAQTLDHRLLGLAEISDLRYTRYADDITFSGEKIELDFPFLVGTIIESEGFEVNQEKSVLMLNNGKVIITGISISRGRLCIPRKFKRELRRRAHMLIKNGIVAESQRNGPLDVFYADRIIGRLTYWSHVEPSNDFPRNSLVAIRRLMDQ